MLTFGPSFTGQTDYLSVYDSINRDGIHTVRQDRMAKLNEARYTAMQAAIEALPDVPATGCSYDHDTVVIGQDADLTDAGQRAAVSAAIDAFVPWKKGPFSLFGHQIDAEWRSDLKWERVRPHIGSLAGQIVADIGCNNGYFMYRMLPLAPRLVIGLEPECRHLLNFRFLQHYARADALHFEPLGIEHMDFYPGFFDTVFCMGILYHHADPVGLLKKIHSSMKKGGQIIVECQGIPGDEPVALMPENRYARARGFWWLPTRSCLVHWLQRSGFGSIDVFDDILLTSTEQRRSSHAPIDSLADFLDPNDPSRTVEGYPAPRRFYLKAIRP
jgi:tRNA (mo5U34)-methyltransferase